MKTRFISFSLYLGRIPLYIHEITHDTLGVYSANFHYRFQKSSLMNDTYDCSKNSIAPVLYQIKRHQYVAVCFRN